MKLFEEIVNFIKSLYVKDLIPLHEPVFLGNEKKYLMECVNSTYVSYVGPFVTKFENMICEYTNVRFSIAVANGTVGLFISLKVVGVEKGDEVITQPLTFVATANAITHAGAHPVFVDVDLDTLGMSPKSLSYFLENFTEFSDGKVINKTTGRKISAIVPVHIFGHPCRIDEIVEIANRYNLPVVEDAAEALGSFYKGKHCGTYGTMGVISFNGNKIITTGGGGMILTNREYLAKKLKHITATAKVPHPYRYDHDEVGYNLRMPNINAALGVAQMEYFDIILKNKREITEMYDFFFKEKGIPFIVEPEGARSNYWLNGIIMENDKERDLFLEYTNKNDIFTRPIWTLMYKLPMYSNCFKIDTPNAEWLEERVVNLPSGYRNEA